MDSYENKRVDLPGSLLLEFIVNYGVISKEIHLKIDGAL